MNLGVGGEEALKGFFSRDELDEFRVRARELNDRNEGDTACFYLRRED